MKINNSALKLPGHGAIKAQYLVIHETSNPGATAKNHLDYWKSGRSDGIYTHFITDWLSDTIYQVCSEQALCWHVGNGNKFSIGIEMCHAQNKNDFEKVWKNTVQFASYVLKKNGWSIDKIISHKTAGQMWGGTDHTDPISYFAKYGKTWQNFINDIKKESAGKTMENSDVIKIWSYKNSKLEKKRDTYQILRDIDAKIDKLEQKIEVLEKEVK